MPPPAVCALALLVATAGTAAGQQSDGASGESGVPTPPAVASDLPAEGWIDRDTPVELTLDRPLGRGERVAVFAGTTDVTDLFRPSAGGEALRYAPRAVGLPAGESELTVYHVTEGPVDAGAGTSATDGSAAPGSATDGASGPARWEEVARFPLRVRGALGLETARFDPSLDLSLEGQLAEGHDPEEAAPLRSTYQDLSGQLSVDGEVTRGDFRGTLQMSVLGVSHQENALRFGELQDDAPPVDLSNYLLQFGLGASTLAQGHVSMGSQRHLISGFSSRGAVMSVKPSDRVDVSVGAVNGSSIVGWDNPIGLEDTDHMVLSGAVGVEVLERPGALRVELTGMDGSVLPFAGFNQGEVNDAEESRGFGLSLQASDASGRLRLEGGFARSAFDNPEDPTLAQEDDLVEVEEEAKSARYLEASVGVLQNVMLSETKSASLTLGWRHERVDPLYRSVGAYAQADRDANRLEAQAQVAGISVRGSHARSEDNLDEVPSILKTLTRRSGVQVGVPLGQLLGSDPYGGGSPWLPSLSWGWDRTRQLADALPENGGFDESHLPDQVSTNHTASADWQFTAVSFGYRFNRSHQDNRQEGRADADFTNLVHGWTLGVRPVPILSVDLSFDLESAENHEVDETDDTRRWGVRTTLSPLEQSTLSFSLSHTVTEDEAETSRRENTQIDAQWASFIPGLERLGAQYYLRFSRSLGETFDSVFDLDDRTENWTLSSGLTFAVAPGR